MQHYDPLAAPDPEEWLELDEAERIALIETHHRKAGIRPPNAQLHAVFHAIVETQAAMGAETPVRSTLERLMKEGADRHEAVHAIGSVLAGHMQDLTQGVRAGKEPPADSNAPYFAALERLTITSWRKEYG